MAQTKKYTRANTNTNYDILHRIIIGIGRKIFKDFFGVFKEKIKNNIFKFWLNYYMRRRKRTPSYNISCNLKYLYFSISDTKKHG